MKELIAGMIGAAVGVFGMLVLEIVYIVRVLLNIPDEHNPD